MSHPQHHAPTAEWSTELAMIEEALHKGDMQSIEGILDRVKEAARRAAEKMRNIKNKVIKKDKPQPTHTVVTVQLPDKYYEEMERMLIIFTRLLEAILLMAGKPDAVQEDSTTLPDIPLGPATTERALYYVMRSQ